MKILMRELEQKMDELLPELIGIIFDGCTSSSVLSESFFAIFPNYEEKCGYRKILLAMSSMDDETSQSTQEHYEYLRFVLSVSDRRLSNVVASVGDKARKNRAFARLIGPVFIGC